MWKISLSYRSIVLYPSLEDSTGKVKFIVEYSSAYTNGNMRTVIKMNKAQHKYFC